MTVRHVMFQMVIFHLSTADIVVTEALFLSALIHVQGVDFFFPYKYNLN